MVGNNFRVNDDVTEEDQYSPSAAMTRDGKFVVVWSDWRGGKGDPDLFAQRFWTNGSRISSNALINQPDSFSYEHQWTIGQSVAANNNRIGFAWTDNRRHKGFDISGKVTDWNLIGMAETKPQTINTNSFFEVYPNPTMGEIKIKFESNSLMPLHISLFDACGRQQQSLVINKNGGDVLLNLINLAKGIYFVTLVTNTGFSECKKIILK